MAFQWKSRTGSYLGLRLEENKVVEVPNIRLPKYPRHSHVQKCLHKLTIYLHSSNVEDPEPEMAFQWSFRTGSFLGLRLEEKKKLRSCLIFDFRNIPGIPMYKTVDTNSQRSSNVVDLEPEIAFQLNSGTGSYLGLGHAEKKLLKGWPTRAKRNIPAAKIIQA